MIFPQASCAQEKIATWLHWNHWLREMWTDGIGWFCEIYILHWIDNRGDKCSLKNTPIWWFGTCVTEQKLQIRKPPTQCTMEKNGRKTSNAWCSGGARFLCFPRSSWGSAGKHEKRLECGISEWALDGCFANTNSNFSQACQWEWWELSEMFFRDFSGRIGTAAQMRGWKVSDPMLKTWVHWWDDAKFGRTKCVPSG